MVFILPESLLTASWVLAGVVMEFPHCDCESVSLHACV